MSKNTFTLMVSGSQKYQHHDTIVSVLQDIHTQYIENRIIVVCSENDGVGALVENIAHNLGWEVQKMFHQDVCNMSQDCFLPNLAQKPDMMVAFSRKGCATTWSHIREARGAGIPLRIYGQGRQKLS